MLSWILLGLLGDVLLFLGIALSSSIKFDFTQADIRIGELLILIGVVLLGLFLGLMTLFIGAPMFCLGALEAIERDGRLRKFLNRKVFK